LTDVAEIVLIQYDGNRYTNGSDSNITSGHCN